MPFYLCIYFVSASFKFSRCIDSAHKTIRNWSSLSSKVWVWILTGLSCRIIGRACSMPDSNICCCETVSNLRHVLTWQVDTHTLTQASSCTMPQLLLSIISLSLFLSFFLSFFLSKALYLSLFLSHTPMLPRYRRLIGRRIHILLL